MTKEKVKIIEPTLIMTLQETVNYIKKEFKQEEILINEFDYLHNQLVLKANPKYLFRGEKIYPTTKSNYHRLLDKNPEVQNILHEYVIDLSVHLMQTFYPTIDNSSLSYKPLINEITGYMQHYGFPIMFLDFTQNIDVAAFFASNNNKTQKGKICIIELKSFVENESFLKLSNSFALRPSLQEAFALRMYNDKPDLKNSNHFKTLWLEFNVTENDIKYFSNKKLLSTIGDRISDEIITFIQTHKTCNPILSNLIQEISNDLTGKKNWT